MFTGSSPNINNTSPVIGLTPLVDIERNSYWMLPGYMDGIHMAGGIPVMLPLSSDRAELERLVSLCQGLLFTGGQDISPSVYGETVQVDNVICCPERDKMELTLLDIALERDIPVLGICRGIQLFNAAFGGSLYQDIPAQRPSETVHSQKPPYHFPVHEVTILQDSPLFSLLRTDCIPVNSYHHQAVRDLTPMLNCMAISEDGIVEAIEKPDQRFFWGVQWHPEFSYATDENSLRIFEAFVKACREYSFE